VIDKLKLQSNLNFQSENNFQPIFSLGKLWLTTEKFYKFKMISNHINLHFNSAVTIAKRR